MSKKPKNEFASSDSFSLAVCNRLRWCVGKRSEAVAERKEMFEKRDSLDSQLGQVMLQAATGAVSKEVLNEAKAKVLDAERSIESLQHLINFFGKTITETVQDADSPELDGMIDEMPMPVVEAPKSAAQVSRENMAKKAEGLTPIEVHSMDGVAEHMNASVNELDLPELQKGRLVKGELETVAKLAAFVDAPGFVQSALEERCSCSDKHAKQILDALQAYRRKHRKAAAAVEKEAVAHG